MSLSRFEINEASKLVRLIEERIESLALNDDDITLFKLRLVANLNMVGYYPSDDDYDADRKHLIKK